MADQYHVPDAHKTQLLKDIANKIRVLSVESTNASNSGHPTSSSSAAEILSVLFFNQMRYSISAPRAANADRVILSKGHACPALYAAWAQTGLYPESDCLNLRKIDSDLEGHPTPRLNFIDAATGSLGQGLSISAGMAYMGKHLDKASYRTYCIIGDGESAEGSNWEALAFGSHYKLDNLVAIFDVNRLGQSEPTSLGHDVDTYKRRLEAFGWHTIVVDGHDVKDLSKAFYDASTTKDKPTAIVAKTYKGRGFPDVEDLDNWHGKPLAAKSDEALAAVKALIVNNGPHGLVPATPAEDVLPTNMTARLSEPPNYPEGAKVATRKAFGTALLKLGRNNNRVINVDGDVKNSTFSIDLEKELPDQFIQAFIAEQNMVGVSIGAAARDRAIVFCSTFAAFFSRAYDQIRMGAVSFTNVNFVGSHVGVSIGEDGPSQMALEDLAMFRAVTGSTVFYPSDAVSAERAIELAANTKGITYTRTSRPATVNIHSNDETFEIGKCKVVRQSDNDQVTVIGGGVTLHEALKAADELKAAGVNIRVIDPFTVKPVDQEGILAAARATNGKVLVVEDHYPEGGLGDAVMAACGGEKSVMVKHLCVRALPRSGPSSVLMEMFGISASCISKGVQQMLSAA